MRLFDRRSTSLLSAEGEYHYNRIHSLLAGLFIEARALGISYVELAQLIIRAAMNLQASFMITDRGRVSSEPPASIKIDANAKHKGFIPLAETHPTTPDPDDTAATT